MNLFLKIFLWFLAAIALMIGVVLFLNWTVQTEPVVSRWQNSVRNQMNIFADTAAQIQANEGGAELEKFLRRIATADTVSQVDLLTADGRILFSDGPDIESARRIAPDAFASRATELELSEPNTALAAKSFFLKDGSPAVLVIRWERPRPAMPFFGESYLRYLRVVGLLLTALILCYLLARYISSPIEKIRRAAQRLAGGDLKTRVADEFGKRHDEIGTLAADFDMMAERIESLIVSQNRLSRDISHELRSPLARLNVALELAKQRSGHESAQLLDRIETESTRLNEMIGRILTLSRLESGSADVERTKIDLKELVGEVVADADFEASANAKSVNFIADECTVVGNERLLRSAIENVLRNAVRYTPKGTAVDVVMTKRDGKAVVEVHDAGGGVPEDELQNLFRPFYRVGEARERKTGGIGLGLAIAERAIRAHHGEISARNSNGGLTVSISLSCGADGGKPTQAS
jgi:two-component system sensor histidine kinase CpxA